MANIKTQAGNLNKKVKIMKLSQVQDGAGGYEDKLVEIKSVWANIQPVYGREFWQAQQVQAQISHKITIRYTKDIDRACIISLGKRLFDIQYITNVNEENRFLELRALERL